MKLEAGKWYKDRCGSKWHVDYAGSAYACGHSDSGSVSNWRSDDGLEINRDGSPLDLISEWPDAPAVGSSAWANSLPVGSKVRWVTWGSRDYAERMCCGWKKSSELLRAPSDIGSEQMGWLLYTEPKLRPWRTEEVPLGAWITMEGKSGRYLITGAKEVDIIVSGIGAISYEQAFNRCKHSTDNGRTWLPCGTLDTQ